MTVVHHVDTGFDVRSDAGGKDPDRYSLTLRRYHQLLWSKPLPSGVPFALDAKLHHSSRLGEFRLSSDAITHTYSTWRRPARLVEIVRQVPDLEMTAFYNLGCTVGAYTVFPASDYVDGVRRLSINQVRGIHPRIRDRFDLTLECVRRHYLGHDSPLREVLAGCCDFFDLFESFAGYVDHFLLNDLLTEDYESVKFLTNFDGFVGDPLPATNYADYREYMRRSIQFIDARNQRIAQYALTRQEHT
jgi:hypothetical protein